MKPLNNDRGAVLVFITLMIVLLMVMVGMGLDTGQMTFTRSQGQGAVDAAALAAVSGLPSGATPAASDAQVKSRLIAFNSTNNYVNSKPSGNPLTDKNLTYVQYNDTTGVITALPDITGANGVRVALEKTNPYSGASAGTEIETPAFLTPLMNLFGGSAPGSNDVNVSAVAALKSVPGIPIAVMVQECKGADVNPNVKLRQTNAKTDNSCWTTYTDNPPSANRIQALFRASRTCEDLPASSDLVTIGTPIELNNGQQAADYDEAYDLFMTKHPGRCWYVPIIPDSTKCNQTSPILDWAKICPTDVVKQPQQKNEPKYIQASVQCQQNLFTPVGLCFSSRLVREPGKGY
jgi:Flp pilus assembly protein TadG